MVLLGGSYVIAQQLFLHLEILTEDRDEEEIIFLHGDCSMSTAVYAPRLETLLYSLSLSGLKC